MSHAGEPFVLADGSLRLPSARRAFRFLASALVSKTLSQRPFLNAHLTAAASNLQNPRGGLKTQTWTVEACIFLYMELLQFSENEYMTKDEGSAGKAARTAQLQTKCQGFPAHSLSL